MCETHGNLNEINKGAKDSNGVSKCWSGYHAAGTKKGRNGGQVRNCVPNESVDESAKHGPYYNVNKRKKAGTSRPASDPRALTDQAWRDAAKTAKKESTVENFADGKNPGRKGLAKRSGVNTKASVSSLRNTAKHSTGEKARMAHWLANMKAGRDKK
jgi:hypothetical protein